MGGYQSGQMGQTVNLLAFAFGGSNPSPPTQRGNSSVVEHFLGKEEVLSSTLSYSSNSYLIPAERKGYGKQTIY